MTTHTPFHFMPIRPLIGGAGLAVVAVGAIHGALEHNQAVLALGLFLAATATSYVGALLAQNTLASVIALEIALGSALLAAALLGVLVDPLWLGAGYAAHGAWDWLHHTRRIPTRVAGWFPPGCAAFDLVAALAIVVLLS